MPNTALQAAPTAAELNAHLAAGGIVQVTTYLRSTVYTSKHAGWFTNKGNALYVRYGRGEVQLAGSNGVPLVGIRCGKHESRYAAGIRVSPSWRDNLDVRHVEAYMLLNHSTLDGLSLEQFNAAVREAIGNLLAEGMSTADLDKLALSYGLR